MPGLHRPWPRLEPGVSVFDLTARSRVFYNCSGPSRETYAAAVEIPLRDHCICFKARVTIDQAHRLQSGQGSGMAATLSPGGNHTSIGAYIV